MVHKKWLLIITFVVVIILSLALVGIWLNSLPPTGKFGPIQPTSTPNGLISSQPITITFSTLNADPYAILDRYVRVTGSFTKLQPIVCTPTKGPQARWALVSDGLQMDMVGLENVIPMIPEGATLTVDGIWRLYTGPLGCGKEPAAQQLWYLEAQRIHAPNPLAFGDVAAQPVVDEPLFTPTPEFPPAGEVELPPLEPTFPSETGEFPTAPAIGITPLPSNPGLTATPRPTTRPGTTPTITLTPSPTPTGTLSPTPTPTIDPNMTGTPTSTVPTPTPQTLPGEGSGYPPSGYP